MSLFNNSSQIDLIESFKQSSIDTPSFLYETFVYSLTIPIFILTAAGNGIILITIKFQARLLSSNSNYLNSNYFILNLAIADFFVGVIVMPLMIAYTVKQSKWTYGQELCDSWMAFDFLCSTASFLTLSAMSIERYKMLTTSYLRIDKQSSKFRIIIFICLSWILPLISWIPLIITNRLYYGPNDYGDCSVSANKYLVLILCVLLYHIPLVFMVVFYTKLIIHIKTSSMTNIDPDNCSLNTINQSFIKQKYNSFLMKKTTKSNSKIIEDNDVNDYLLETINPEKINYNLSTSNNDLRASLKCKKQSKSKRSRSISLPSSQSISINFINKLQIKLKCYKKGNAKRKKSNEYNLELIRQHSIKYQNRYNYIRRSCSNINNKTPSFVNGCYSQRNSSAKKSISIENESNFINKNVENFNKNLETTNNNEFDNKNSEIMLIMKKSPTTLVINRINSLTKNINTSINRYSFRSKKDNLSFFENANYNNIRLKRNRKAARMLGLLVTAFLICWFPFSICYPLGQFFPNTAPNYIIYIIWWMGYLNSTINPFLYVYSNKTIRRSVRDLFYKRLWQFFTGANKIDQNFRSVSLKNFSNQNNKNINGQVSFINLNEQPVLISKNNMIVSNTISNNMIKNNNNIVPNLSNNTSVYAKRLATRQLKLKK